MAGRLADIAARRAELASARAELRAERRQERAAAAKTARQWAVVGSLRNVVLILYDLAQGNVKPAIAYLEGVARQRRWPPRSESDVRTLVEDVYLEATADAAEQQAFIALTSLDEPIDKASMDVAIRRYAEWRVVVWTRNQNENVGQVGSASQMLDELDRMQAALPPNVRPQSRGASDMGRNRKWLSRLRARYRGRVGKLKVRDVIPQEVMLAKARGARGMACRAGRAGALRAEF